MVLLPASTADEATLHGLEAEAGSPTSRAVLRLWQLGEPSQPPTCVRSLKVFGDKTLPEPAVTSIAVADDLSQVALGLDRGGVLLARSADVYVTGITLSTEQLRVARDRASAAGVSDRVRFALADYRQVAGRFDRIVSVGMFEHVGAKHYRDYFGAIDRLLTDDGVALVHSIGRKDRGPGFDRWTQEHIFPGGYIPAVSEALAALEETGLWLTDLEVLRLHYAETLRHWRLRAAANRPAIEAIYDARFYRMWEFYLASCEMGFRFNGLMVFQAQIARDVASLPITRTYITEAEQGLHGARPRPQPKRAHARRKATAPETEAAQC